MSEDQEKAHALNPNGGFIGAVERIGNKLPDPAVLFIALLFIVWVLSWLLSYVTFSVIDPRSGEALVVNYYSPSLIELETGSGVSVTLTVDGMDGGWEKVSAPFEPEWERSSNPFPGFPRNRL